MPNLLISPEQFIEQKKTALKWQIFGIDFFIKATTKRHKIQILPEHERPSISKKMCNLQTKPIPFNDQQK